MGDQTQAYDIFQTPLSSGYPLPLTPPPERGAQNPTVVSGLGVPTNPESKCKELK